MEPQPFDADYHQSEIQRVVRDFESMGTSFDRLGCFVEDFTQDACDAAARAERAADIEVKLAYQQHHDYCLGVVHGAIARRSQLMCEVATGALAHTCSQSIVISGRVDHDQPALLGME